MKTKTILLLCLFLGIGLTQLNAQLLPPDNKTGTGIVSFYEYVTDISGYWDIPVVCGGEEINHLTGNVTGFSRVFFKGDTWIWQNSWYEWDLTGNDGETFKGKDIWKWVWSDGIGYGHANLIGNKGTHYIVSYSMDSSWVIVFLDIKCPGSK